jgi:hypothetical protein
MFRMTACTVDASLRVRVCDGSDEIFGLMTLGAARFHVRPDRVATRA